MISAARDLTITSLVVGLCSGIPEDDIISIGKLGCMSFRSVLSSWPWGEVEEAVLIVDGAGTSSL